MKIIIAIISNDDANKVQKAFVENNIIATRLATTSGFLRTRNSTFLIGVKKEKVDDVISIIKAYSNKRTKVVPNAIVNEFGAFSALPIEVEVGGATVFVVNAEEFMKF